MNLESLVLIGNIVNTFGRKGFVKILLIENLNLVAEQLQSGFFFYEDHYKIFQPLKIQSYTQPQTNLLLVKFEEIDSLDAAEKIKNLPIYSLKKDAFFEMAPNYLEYQLVFDLKTEHVEVPVVAEMKTSQYNLFKIFWKQQELWIPNVEEYIVNIDDKQKRIFAKNIERFI